jgi:hypothetical protein
MNVLLPNLSSEEKLLLSLCRLEFSKEQRAKSGELLGEVKDWERFVNLANEHGIIALAANNIHELGFADHVPLQSMKQLDNALMQSMIRNTWLAKRWKEVNIILSDANIKHVLLKGMALEHTVYGARGLRQMTDTDILVKRNDALKAWLILQQHGFVPELIKSPLHRKIITDIGKHLPTLLKDGYVVEIHNRLFYEADKNEIVDEAIENAITFEIEGAMAFMLRDDINLEYLKNHYQDHMASGGSQLRLWLDMELLKPGSGPAITREFLSDPDHSAGREQRKEYYRIQFFSIPVNERLRFLAGDIFPSIKWMKQRHGCGSVKALFLYPRRIGKVGWLLKG